MHNVTSFPFHVGTVQEGGNTVRDVTCMAAHCNCFEIPEGSNRNMFVNVVCRGSLKSRVIVCRTLERFTK